jgi:hypothetical protein
VVVIDRTEVLSGFDLRLTIASSCPWGSLLDHSLVNLKRKKIGENSRKNNGT